MIRKIAFVPNEWYHCYNRGVDKKIIFKNTADYRRFIMLLYACNSTKRLILSNFGKNYVGPSLDLIVKAERGEQLVDIGAYALMPNHYHLLLRECTPGGITSFMRKIGTGYAMSFNIKYKRTGTLFSSRFQARHVLDDRYMRRLVHYIHANPVELFEPEFKKGVIKNRTILQQKLLSYQYSSFPDYQKKVNRLEKILLNQESLFDAIDFDFSFSSMIRDALDFSRTSDTETMQDGPT